MKTRYKIIIGIFVACLAVTAGIWMEVLTGRQMRAAVEQALEQNRNYEPFTSDTIYLSPHSSPTSTPSPSGEGRGEAISLRDAVAYYRHPLRRLWTSSNDCLRAGYALGCVYRDLHEAPIAIITWEEAVAAADTTADDCDYATLYRVYGQMASLYMWQHLPERQLLCEKCYSKYALLAGDTLISLHGKLLCNSAYYTLGDTAAIFANSEAVRQQYLKLGLTQEAARVYPTPIHVVVENGQYERARRMMDEYERNSGLFGEDGFILDSTRVQYHYYKGLYYLGLHHIDSAELQFRHLLPFQSTAMSASRGLIAIFHEKRNVDSIQKYSQLFDKLTDDELKNSKNTAIIQAEGMYDFSRQQQKAQNEEKKADRRMLELIVSAIAIVALIIISIFFNKKERLQKRVLELEYNKLEDSYYAAPRLVATTTLIKRADLANRQTLCGDFNGDGLIDLLLSPASGGESTTWKKYLSKGDGTFAQSSFTGFTYDNPQRDGFIAQDINNDGLCDLIGYTSTMIKAMLSNGDSFNSEIISTDTPHHFMAVIPANVNSRDRLTQLLALWNNQVATFSYNNQSENESLIVGMADSYGVIEKNTYQLLTDENGIYQFNPASSNASFPYVSLYERFPLVKAVSTFMDRQLIGMNTYTYENAIFHRQGLGFRGFEKITETNLRGQQTVMTFDQTQFGILKSFDSPASMRIYAYSVTVSGNKLAKIRMTGVYEEDLVKDIQTYTSYTYDSYGNPRSILKSYSDGTTISTQCHYNNYSTVSSGYQLGCLYQKTTSTNYNGSTYTEKYYVPAFTAKHLPIVEVKSKNGQQVHEVINTYDSHGNLMSESVKEYTSTDRQVTTYSYDYLGRLSGVTGPTGNTTQYAYNTRWDMVMETDPRGGVTHYTYDSSGRVTSITYPDGTNATAAYEWNSQAPYGIYAVTRTKTGKPTTVTHYDALNREVRLSDQRFDGEYRHIDKLYDEYGNLTSESFPYKGSIATQWRGWEYDEFGRLTEDIYSQGMENTYIYNGLSVYEYDNDNALKSVHTYDVLGNLVSVTDDGGTISYDLGADGQPNSITAPDGITTSFTYDQSRRRTSITDPSMGTTTYTYDNAGNLSGETDANDNTTSYSYDAYNRLVTTVHPEMTVTRSYDTYGNIAYVNASNGVTKSISYDEYGRLDEWEESIDGIWLKKKYSYYDGNISKIAYSTHLGLLSEERFLYRNGHWYIGYDHELNPMFQLNQENGLGLPTEVVTYNVKRNYSFNETGIPTNRKAEKNLPLFRSLINLQVTYQDVNYTFNPATMNLQSRTVGAVYALESFGYDSMNRLTSYGNNTATYDAKGNILSKSDVGTMTYTDSQKPYAVTDLQYTGCSMSDDAQDITYYSFHRPATIAEGDYSATFTYDGDFDRVKQVLTNDGTVQRTKYYLGGCYEYVVEPYNTYEALYLFGGYYKAPMVIKKSANSYTNYHLVRDYLGTVTHVIDPQGIETNEYRYDAWGNLLHPATGEIADKEYQIYYGPRFRGYCGHEHLAEFGLINMNARLYDPVTSRFLAPDPYVQAPDNSQSFNRYSYCLNNPLKYVDENGENPLAALFIGVGVGALIGAGTSALSYSISSAGNWHRQDFWRAVGIGAVSGAIGGAFGALGSMAGAGAIGNSIGYNFLSGTVNTVVTRSMFGQHLDWKDILPIMSASVIGSCFPSYGGVNGGWLANSAAEIGYNTLKGSTMGFAAGVTDAAIHHDNSRIWQNIAGGAVSGAARTMAIQLILGVKQDFNADSALPGFYRSGGLASLLPREWGLTLGNQSFVVSMSEQKTVLHEYFHLEQIRALGWANFYGRLIFEYIRDGFIGSYLKYLDLEWEAEIYSRFLMHETFENWEFRR